MLTLFKKGERLDENQLSKSKAGWLPFFCGSSNCSCGTKKKSDVSLSGEYNTWKNNFE